MELFIEKGSQKSLVGERRIWTRKRGKLSKEAMSRKRMGKFGSIPQGTLKTVVTPCNARCGPWTSRISH